MGSCFKAMRKKKNSYTLDHPVCEAGDSFNDGKQPSLQSWSSIEKVQTDKVSNAEEKKSVDDKKNIDISTSEHQHNDSDHEQVENRNGTIDVKGGKIKWSKNKKKDKKKDKKKKKGKKTDDSSSEEKSNSDKKSLSSSSSDEDVSKKEDVDGNVRSSENDTTLNVVPVIQIDTVSSHSSTDENVIVEAGQENENHSGEEIIQDNADDIIVETTQGMADDVNSDTEELPVCPSSPTTWDSQINIGDGGMVTTTSEMVVTEENVEVESSETHPTESDIRTEEITEVQVVEHTETDIPEESQNLHNEQTEFQSIVVVDVNDDNDLPRDVELASMEDEIPNVDPYTDTPEVQVTTVHISD